MDWQFWSKEQGTSRQRRLLFTFCIHFIFLQVLQPEGKWNLLLICSLLQKRSSRLLMFFAVLVTSLGPSPQSSTPCQQNFPCCTACLVWLVLGAREISLWWQVAVDRLRVARDRWYVTHDFFFVFKLLTAHVLRFKFRNSEKVQGGERGGGQGPIQKMDCFLNKWVFLLVTQRESTDLRTVSLYLSD